MDTSKDHQEQNKILAKVVNHLKMELRKSKHEVISLRHQLQLSRKQNAVLAEQQANLFESVGNFENHLDQVFANNSFNYVLLSTGIEQITSKNPSRSFNHSIGTQNVSHPNEANNSMVRIQSNINARHSFPAMGKPQQRSRHSTNTNQIRNPVQSSTQLRDILNTAFLADANGFIDDSMLPPQSNTCSSNQPSKTDNIDQKCVKPSRLPVASKFTRNLKRHASGSIDSQGNVTPSRRRCSSKSINYQELHINRKMRRTN